MLFVRVRANHELVIEVGGSHGRAFAGQDRAGGGGWISRGPHQVTDRQEGIGMDAGRQTESGLRRTAF